MCTRVCPALKQRADVKVEAPCTRWHNKTRISSVLESLTSGSRKEEERGSEGKRSGGGGRGKGREGGVGCLNNSVFRQVTEFHVTESFPWADHCDICAETLHAGDVVTESGGRGRSSMS